MSRYLDINVVIGLLTDDPLTSRAVAVLHDNREDLMISDFGAAEFAAVIARRARLGTIARQHALDALALFDHWTGRNAQRVEVSPGDVVLAETYLRRLDLPLLAPDAIHIAITQRLGATLVTFDQRMAAAARTLGIAVAEA